VASPNMSPRPTSLPATCSSSRGKKNCGTGADVTSDAGSNFLIYWNAGELRSTLNGVSLPGGVSTAGTSSNNGTKSDPTLTADLLGDWREELVARETANTALRIYTTTIVTKAASTRSCTIRPTGRRQVLSSQATTSRPTWDSTSAPVWPIHQA